MLTCTGTVHYMLLYYDEAILQRKTASTKPMYSRNHINPRVYENTLQLHNKVIERQGNTPQCLGCGIIVATSQLYYYIATDWRGREF